MSLFVQQLRALNTKNWIIFKRNKNTFILELVFPIICLLLVGQMRKGLRVQHRVEQEYSKRTFYSHPTYSGPASDGSSRGFMSISNSNFTCPESSVVAIIGTDPEGLLQGTMQNEFKIRKVKKFERYQDFSDFIHGSDSDVASKEKQESICKAFQLVKEGNTYKLTYFSDDFIEQSGGPELIQGDISPKISKAFEGPKYTAFPSMATMVAQSIARKHSKPDIKPEFIISFTPQRTPAFTRDEFAENMGTNFAPLLLIIFFLPYMNLITRALQEKQSKARETMRMMGMRDSAYFISYFIMYTCQVVIISLVVTLIGGYHLFNHSSSYLLFMFYTLYGLSLFGQALAIIAIFSNTKTGTAAGSIVQFLVFYLHYAIADSSSETLKYVASLVSNFALLFGTQTIWKLESDGRGAQLSNMTTLYQNYCMSTCFKMLFIDIFVYFLIGMYLTYVVNQEFGIKKHPLFCFTKQFWCGWGRNRPKEQSKGFDQFTDESYMEEGRSASPNFEELSQQLLEHQRESKCLEIRNLQKTYSNGTRAVDDLNLTMFQDQIFALLGHNGAGKTSTISILTGLYQANGGKAQVYGIDALQEQEELRKITGVCPQHDILFDQLTPEEHLGLFADIKGLPSHKKARAIATLLSDLHLTTHSDIHSKNLSGGQKRKVSVGIALIGDSKLVLLDEPTAGMDPTARRHLWDMLKDYKQGRILILTTHFMEEADILGDRIGIMVAGKAECCGSSLFLKNRFGSGYTLTIEKASPQASLMIESFVEAKVKGAQKISDIKSKVEFRLPNDAAEHFSQLYTELEQRKDDLQILSYGISITTLEEVFLKVGEGDVNHLTSSLGDSYDMELSDLSQVSGYRRPQSYSLDRDGVITGAQLMWEQFKVMSRIKAKMSIRDMKGFLGEVIWPAVMLVIGTILVYLIMNNVMTKSINFSNLTFPRPQHLYYSNNIEVDPDHHSLLYKHSQIFLNTLHAKSSWSYDPIKINSTNLNFTSEFYTNNDFGPNNRLLEILEQMDKQHSKLKELDHDYASVYFNQMTAEGRYHMNTFIDVSGKSIMFMMLEQITNTLIQISTGKDIKFELVGSPMPKTKTKDRNLALTLAITTVMSYSISIGILTSQIASSLVKEKTTGIKHQQIVSGASRFVYWMSNYFIDILKSVPLMLGFISLRLWVDIDLPYAWVLIILGPFALMPFTYMISFMFEQDSKAQTFFRNVHLYTSGMPALGTAFMMQYPPLKTIVTIVSIILSLNPGYCFCLGICKIMLSQQLPQLLKDQGIQTDIVALNPLSLDVAGKEFLILAVEIFVYWILVYIIENDICSYLNRCSSKGRQIDQMVKEVYASENGMDSDVQDEEQRVLATSQYESSIRCSQVQKVYNSSSEFQHAVRDISFGVDNGECFALLGVNGAGKTTTFKSLTGDVTPSAGEVHIMGFNVKNRPEFKQARKLIGYCPQFDCVFTNITVREHLKFYGKVKGIPNEHLRQEVERCLDDLNLRNYATANAHTLSGGNKRKLSVAMAMIGNPPIVLLDEPSTGMDPKAKRFMWNVIHKISAERKESAVVLTTHSMEEADALSTKLGIMVSGQLKCFGTSQHIKNKFGQGYEIEFKISQINETKLNEVIQTHDLDHTEMMTDYNMQIVLAKLGLTYLKCEISHDDPQNLGFDLYSNLLEGCSLEKFLQWAFMTHQALSYICQIVDKFGEVVMIENYGAQYKLKVPHMDHKEVGNIFEIFEGADRKCQYSVTQTTLEQIFNSFAHDYYSNGSRHRSFTPQNTPQIPHIKL